MRLLAICLCGAAACLATAATHAHLGDATDGENSAYRMPLQSPSIVDALALPSPTRGNGPTLGTGTSSLVYAADNLDDRPFDGLLTLMTLTPNVVEQCVGDLNERSGLVSGLDFGPGGVLYSYTMSDDADPPNPLNRLATVDPTSGASVLVGVADPGAFSITGMTWEAVSGRMLVCDERGGIWPINLADGQLGQRIAHSNNDDGRAPFLVDIAAQPGTGTVYGMELRGQGPLDRVVTLDLTGTSAPIGDPLGVDTNFSQGMAFDLNSGVLYIEPLNNSPVYGDFGRVNLTTGAFARIDTAGKCHSVVVAEYGDFTIPAGGPCDPCDANCDGDVNAFDIEPFIDDVFNGDPQCSPCASDADGNGHLDAFDIQPFIDCLFGP